jgi:hypothetical protein
MSDLGGIPVFIDASVPAGELWIIKDRDSHTILIPELPGESVEEYLRKTHLCKIVDIGRQDA